MLACVPVCGALRVQMWYCVSPKHKDKFERMASSLFPQQAQACQAFIRHKDILVSPSQLRAHSVPYMQVSAGLVSSQLEPRLR